MPKGDFEKSLGRKEGGEEVLVSLKYFIKAWFLFHDSRNLTVVGYQILFTESSNYYDASQ
jgi:hypothetical protein